MQLQVQPNAPKSALVGEHNQKLKIKIKSPPVDGKANEALEEFVAELFGVSKSKVRVVKGLTSRLKTLEIQGINIADAEKILDNVLGSVLSNVRRAIGKKGRPI